MKILILRFSSFGDIIQALDAPAALRELYPDCEIHWAVRSDFESVVKMSPHVQRVWSLDRTSGVSGLLRLAQDLHKQKFTHVYDAHNNLRSRFIGLFLLGARRLRRSKNRLKRFLLFRLRWNLLPQPFRGRKSYLEPLRAWGASRFPQIPRMQIQPLSRRLPSSYFALVPATAWKKKTWPPEHWQALIESLHNWPLVLLGGPQDTFIDEIVQNSQHPQLLNLRGKLSLDESCAVVSNARVVISADTGLMHVADQLEVPTICLIGPSAFGYPASSNSFVLETKLKCKPCSKDGSGPCRNATYQKCMKDITPAMVHRTLLERTGL